MEINLKNCNEDYMAEQEVQDESRDTTNQQTSCFAFSVTDCISFSSGLILIIPHRLINMLSSPFSSAYTGQMQC